MSKPLWWSLTTEFGAVAGKLAHQPVMQRLDKYEAGGHSLVMEWHRTDFTGDVYGSIQNFTDLGAVSRCRDIVPQLKAQLKKGDDT